MTGCRQAGHCAHNSVGHYGSKWVYMAKPGVARSTGDMRTANASGARPLSSTALVSPSRKRTGPRMGGKREQTVGMTVQSTHRASRGALDLNAFFGVDPRRKLPAVVALGVDGAAGALAPTLAVHLGEAVEAGHIGLAALDRQVLAQLADGGAGWVPPLVVRRVRTVLKVATSHAIAHYTHRPILARACRSKRVQTMALRSAMQTTHSYPRGQHVRIADARHGPFAAL
jgi:hypothetical protein